MLVFCRSSLWRLSSASFAFLARISSRRCCILALPLSNPYLSCVREVAGYEGGQVGWCCWVGWEEVIAPIRIGLFGGGQDAMRDRGLLHCNTFKWPAR